MVCYITNKDGTMYVHELRGVVFITWVSSADKKKALAFPHDTALEWCKIVEKMTGVECSLTNPKRPGML